MLQSIGASSLFLVGTAGSVWCYENHLCMCGHMRHGPYSIWEYFADAGWVGSLILGTFWLTQIRSPISIAVACFVGFLVSYRFMFGSFGGAYWIPI